MLKIRSDLVNMLGLSLYTQQIYNLTYLDLELLILYRITLDKPHHF